jgi:hypothetical protein
MSYVLIIDVLVKVKLGNPSSYLEQWLHFWLTFVTLTEK